MMAVLADMARAAGFSLRASVMLQDAEADIPLAKQALTMCKAKFPDSDKFAELQALYLLGILDYPPD